MKHFTQLFAILFIAFPLFVSCNFSRTVPIYGNHQLINQRIDIENYEEVILDIPGEVFYQQFSDSAPYFQIHTDENIYKVLDVKVQNRKLFINVKKDSIIKPSQLTVYTCSHNIKRVQLTGSGEMRLKGEVNAKDCDLNITGSGSLLADSLVCEKITASISGSGNINLTGASNRSTFTVTGSGNIKAYDYLVQKAECKITGSGDIETFITGQLKATITGSGNLFYKGDPSSIDKQVTGSGKVKNVD